MTTRLIVNTAEEYARALVPHLEHAPYRADAPERQLMGKGCRTCAVEVLIAISAFRETGDLEVFEKEMKPYVKKGKKEEKGRPSPPPEPRTPRE